MRISLPIDFCDVSCERAKLITLEHDKALRCVHTKPKPAAFCGSEQSKWLVLPLLCGSRSQKAGDFGFGVHAPYDYHSLDHGLCAIYPFYVKSRYYNMVITCVHLKGCHSGLAEEIVIQIKA